MRKKLKSQNFVTAIVNLISQNELGATVELTIKKTLTFQEILTAGPAKELPEFWTDFYLDFMATDDYVLVSYGKYFQLSVSVQGDLGLSCVFTKIDTKYVICKVNHWSFSENYNYGGTYNLPLSIKEKIFPTEI